MKVAWHSAYPDPTLRYHVLSGDGFVCGPIDIDKVLSTGDTDDPVSLPILATLCTKCAGQEELFGAHDRGLR